MRIEESRVRARRPRRAGHGDQQTLKVTVETERQFRDLFAFEQTSGVGAVSLQQRRRSRVNVDGLAEFTYLQRQIGAHCGIHVYLHVVAHDFLEAFQRGFDAIDAVLDVGKQVITVGIGRRGLRDIGTRFYRGDRRTSRRRAVAVSDRTEQRAFDSLRVRR